MGCCDDTNLDGQVIRQVQLLQPMIVGGRMLGTVLGTDCAGREVQAGAQLATCEDVRAAINALPPPPVVPEFPVQILLRQINVLQDHRLQLVLSDGTTLTTDTNPGVFTDHTLIEGTGLQDDPVRGDPDRIAALFLTCAGSPHAPGDAIPTCTEMRDAITDAITEASVVRECAHAPLTSASPELPTTLYGGREALLGAPMGFIEIGGFRIPHYGPCAPTVVNQR